MLFEELCVNDYLKRLNEFDATLDVRSPGEFNEAYIPGSFNLFALNDAERADVGTLHKRSAFEAKVLGAGLICKNISEHLKTFHPRFTPAQKLAIYCARGQMRSGSVATVLGHVGYRLWRIRGGFKAYRQAVLAFFDALPDYRFVVLDGPTGSGKSELIGAVDWSLDLEGLARHRGSAFGALAGAQPGTKQFENLLMHRLMAFAPGDAVLIESESRNIGRIAMPGSVYEAMGRGVRVWVETPLQKRIERIVAEYGSITQAGFDEAMGRIAPHMARAAREAIQTAFVSGDLPKTAELLLVEYYDKVYKRPPRTDAVIRFDSPASAVDQLESLRRALK
ncbi:MAG: tRNA 2-selenouridine(34) synthase MnmH [Campylobacterales bacterium]